MNRALVRRPSLQMDQGLVTHIERRPLDLQLALRQWDEYVSALQSVDWDIIEVDAAPDCPDSVFVEDTMVVWGDQAVIANPGAPQRAAEILGARAAIASLGYRISCIEPPVTLDGGDVLKIGRRMYVGVGARSTHSACDQLATFFDVDVLPVPITRTLHLKSAVTALPDGTVIGYPPNVADPGVFDTFLPVPEASGSHVVVIDDKTVLMASSAPQTKVQLESRGLLVITVDISEFEKLEGCVTCLSVRLRT